MKEKEETRGLEKDDGDEAEEGLGVEEGREAGVEEEQGPKNGTARAGAAPVAAAAVLLAGAEVESEERFECYQPLQQPLLQ